MNAKLASLCLGILAFNAWAQPEVKPGAQPPAPGKLSTGKQAPVAPAATPAATVVADAQPLPEADFKKFEPPGEGFSMMIPKDATVEGEKDKSGKDVPGVWRVEGSIGNSQFLFSRLELDAESRTMFGNNEHLFGMTVFALLHASKGMLKSNSPMKYRGADAHEFVIVEAKRNVLGRLAIVGDVFYSLIVSQEGTPPLYAKAFLDSLEFTAASASPGGATDGPKK